MRKNKNIQPINREDKAKTSRNRGYVMKYPWIRDKISADILSNIHGYANNSTNRTEKTEGMNQENKQTILSLP